MSVLELAPPDVELAHGQEAEPATSPAAPSYHWRPLEEPPAAPRRRGIVASLTSFFIAYHTA